VRIKAHFSSGFLSLSPAEQQRTFDELEAAFESLHLRNENDPRVAQPFTINALVIDRPNEIFYVVNGTRLYPVRAKGLHMFKRPERCGDRLSVEIDAEWVTDSPPLESAPAPPSEPDPDGLLIFKGKHFTQMDELRQTKFQRIRYPKDLPDGLKPAFPEETNPAPSGPSGQAASPPALYGPATGFMPLEVGVWQEELPRNSILLFYYKRRGIWEEALFPLKMTSARSFSTRLISRFDLNHNGKMEYLVEVQESLQNYRLIYEVDEEGKEATLLATTPDSVFIRDRTNPQCGKSGNLESVLPEAPAEAGTSP